MYASAILTTYAGFSPRDVYKFHCEKGGVREIGLIRDSLPSKVDDFASVKEMDLSSTLLGDNGAYAVLETVRALYKLEVLRLNGCNVTNAIVKMLAQVAVSHPSLQVIDLSDNEFLSAPCGELLLEVVRKAPGIIRVSMGKTNVPGDLMRKIRTQLAQNVKGFLTTSDPEGVHSFLLEAAISEVLSDSERFLLTKTVRTQRLDSVLRDAAPPVVGLLPQWDLPQLTRDEMERAEDCFRKEDPNEASVLGLSRVVDCLKSYGVTGADQDDVFLKHVFEKLNTAENGFISTREWLILLRNVLAYESGVYKQNHARQLRMAYDLAGTGSDTTALHASACISNLSNITGRSLPDSLEDKVQNILIAASGLATMDESLIPMSLEVFSEAETVCECLINRTLREAVLHNKLYVEDI